MKVAIIGAGGFIGNRLVECFHLGGEHSVVPVVRRPAGLALPARFAAGWRLADALDAGSLARACAGCDAVVHAALGDARQIEAMPASLAAAAAAAGVGRIVYLSSASVHGQAPAPGTTEATPLQTGHALEYSNAKVRAEQSFFREVRRHRLAGFALRPGVVYGPRSRWIVEAVADLRARRAWVLRDGSGICNAISVDNLAATVAACLSAPAAAAGAYLVGDRETVTWREYYLRIAAGIGVPDTVLRSIEHLPTFRRSAGARVRHVVARPEIQSLLPLIPDRLKQTTKRWLAAAEAPRPPDRWRLPPEPAPRITEELALLQQCRWKLPHDLAAARIGYNPSISFDTGMDRSLAWLAFAEGRA